ncbi:transcription factor bHLH7-like [Gastrolobium bilobum]|uniref:transcription factor bHLH7-like n=1 Tax=Gastrolobium bilobum TaxID=150636 RepID=UPI002AB2F169|nr:transcription factor bHLH7-like [Gastrolobium bilobum]
MEGQSNQENPVQLMSCDTRGTSNHVSHSAEDHLFPNPKFFISASGRNGSHWTCLPKPSHNYVEYLSESSTYLPNATPEYMIGSSFPPVGSINDGNGGVNGNENAYGFKPADSLSNNIDIRKQVGFWRLDEGEKAIKVETEISQNLLYAESHASWTADSVGDNHNTSRLDPMVMVGAPAFLPKPGCSSSKQKTRVTDRQRRQRIADNLKALHELLPDPAEGSEAYILDDIIDYVKYLQLQIKELSGSRLQAESSALPLVFHEGYGHYINQQMLNEPLEEIMGKLVEEHSAAASQLLESKGLFLVPMALVDDLNEAVQMFGGSALV